MGILKNFKSLPAISCEFLKVFLCPSLNPISSSLGWDFYTFLMNIETLFPIFLINMRLATSVIAELLIWFLTKLNFLLPRLTISSNVFIDMVLPTIIKFDFNICYRIDRVAQNNRIIYLTEWTVLYFQFLKIFVE